MAVTLGNGVVTVSGGDDLEQAVYDGGLTVPFSTQISLPPISGDFVIGTHDFTGDNRPELKNPLKGALYTWTCHADRFDFKASDGTSDPAALLPPAEEQAD